MTDSPVARWRALWGSGHFSPRNILRAAEDAEERVGLTQAVAESDPAFVNELVFYIESVADDLETWSATAADTADMVDRYVAPTSIGTLLAGGVSLVLPAAPGNMLAASVLAAAGVCGAAIAIVTRSVLKRASRRRRLQTLQVRRLAAHIIKKIVT